ncbi:uncharacterized protein LOC114188611 [Vigna unguiculata]|uniref:uncharacterized protein LOC114188611 n=1 Tax=Vigna unguiculata TaxID=3917 RepID=UPI0010168071|nr:uncharacterized protein LOC114188611 [Vigna unguiculata]
MVALSEEIIEHRDIVSSMFKGMEEVKESLNYVQLSKAMFDAAKSGNIMILEILLEYHPDLLFEVNSEQRSLLHIAILYQQRAIYRLILSKGDSKNVMTQLVDFEGNNVLHLAAKPVPKPTIGSPTDRIIMRRQAFFQAVEKIVPPAIKRMRNNEGCTPEEVFYLCNEELHKKSVSGVKSSANTLLLVVTLIITLGITATITIPVHDIDSTITPIFSKKTWYALFLVSVSVGTYLCGSSLMFYSSIILPSGGRDKRKIYEAASGNWSEGASSLHGYWWRIPITDSGITALHTAMGIHPFVLFFNYSSSLEVALFNSLAFMFIAIVSGDIDI